MNRSRPAESSCGEQHGFRAFQEPAGHLARHGRKALKEFLKRVVAFEVIEQRLHGDSSALEYQRAAEDVRVHCDEVIRVHGWNLPVASPRVNQESRSSKGVRP